MTAPDLPLWLVLLPIVPLFYGLGRAIGDAFDYLIDPPSWGFDWAKFGGLCGGTFGLAVYLAFLITTAIN